MSENPDNGHYDPAMDDYEQEDECPNCGGEGIVYSCFEEWACVDPEGGCDLCERRCDWCQPRKAAAPLPATQGDGE